MAGDGRIDGKMTVQRGQGISQVIKEELGLTQAECNKLGRSVWSQIFAKVEEENSKHKIYDKKIGEGANVNYLIHPDQVIEFSKEVWSQIVNLVNTKLGKNITSAENEAPQAAEDVDAPEAAAEETPVESDMAATTIPPEKDTNPPSNDLVDIPDNTCFSKTAQTIDKALWLVGIRKEYDENGRVAARYDNNGNMTRRIIRNSDGNVEHYRDYELDKNGNQTREITRNADGTVNNYIDFEHDENGNETRIIFRNSDGTVSSYTDIKYDENGDYIGFTRKNPDGSIKED